MNDEINRIIKSIHLETKRGSVIQGKLVIDWKVIKENCLRIADEFLIQTHQNKIPISLESVCESRKIRVNQISLNSTNHDFQGEIIPCDQGFIVNLNSKHSDARKRATLAHEIGHSLFYDTSKSPPKKVYSYNDSEEEWICWDFARSLLLPRFFMTEFLSNNRETPKPQIISDGANDFKVSVDMLLKRIRWDFKCWNDVTIFVGSSKNERFIVTRDNIYKGVFDKNITIIGKDGIINRNPLKTFISFLSRDPNIKFFENKISESYTAELFRLNSNPFTIIGIIRQIR